MKVATTAERLKEIMEDRNLRQTDILRLTMPYVEKAGLKMNRSDLSQYVSGKVEPGPEKLEILAKALKVSEVWLMGYDPDDLSIVAEEDVDLFKWAYKHNYPLPDPSDKVNALNAIINELGYNITALENSYSLTFNNQYGTGSVCLSQNDVDYMVKCIKKYAEIVTDNLLYKYLEENNTENIYIKYPKPQKLVEF